MLMDRGNYLPLIDYEKVNRETPVNRNIMEQVQLAKSMLNQNIPIEIILQETGLPRETIEQIFISGQNITRPPTPTTPPPAMPGQDNRPTQQQMIDKFEILGLEDSSSEEIDNYFQDMRNNPTDPKSQPEQNMLDAYTGNGGTYSQPAGINSLQSNLQPDVADLMPNAENLMPNVGTDIADYLVDELGFDPATGGTIDEPSIIQQLNQANASIALDSEDPVGDMQGLLSAQGALSELPEKSQLDIYRSALVDYYKDAGQNYKDLIKTPDEGLPFLVAGLSLIESGEAGDNWRTALSKSVGKYAVAKKQGQSKYDAQIQDIDIKNMMSVDATMADLVKKNIDYQLKTEYETRAGTRKDYVTKIPGQANSNLEAMTSLEVADFKDRYGPNSIMEYDASNSAASGSNFTITYNNGQNWTTWMSNNEAAEYRKKVKAGIISNFAKAGVESQSDSIVIGYKDKGSKAGYTYVFGSPEDYVRYANDENLDVASFKPDETIEVIDRTNDMLKPVSMREYLNNMDKYKVSGGLSANISNGDTTISIGKNSLPFNAGQTADDVNKLIRETKTNFANRKFMTTRIFQTADNILEIMDGMGPDVDLAFDNPAGRLLTPATKLATSLLSVGRMFESSTGMFEGTPIKKFEYKIVGEDGVARNATYNELFRHVQRMPEFEELMGSPTAGWVRSTGVERERIQAGLFGLAILSAGSMGGEASTDMRAISDKDLITQFERVGRLAANADSARALITDLKRDVLLQEKAYLEAASENAASDFYSYQKRGKNDETGFMEWQGVNAWDATKSNEQTLARIREIDELLDSLGPVSGASTSQVNSNGLRTNPITIEPTVVNGVSYNPDDMSGYTLGSNEVTFAQLVAYARSIPVEKKTTLNVAIKNYFNNAGTPELYQAFINMYNGI